MAIISDICMYLFLGLILVIPITLIVLLFRFISKKPCKKLGKVVLCGICSIVPLAIVGTLTDPATWCEHKYEIIEEVAPTCTEKGKIVKYCPLCENKTYEYPDMLSHSWEEDVTIAATCTTEGYTLEKCANCSATQKTNKINSFGHNMKEISRTEPTNDEDGKILYKCNQCGLEDTEVIANPNGSKENPYVLDAEEWYKKHSKGQYINKYVKVTGLVLNISDYNTLKGYYLVGGPGSGLVCWVDNGKTTIQYGQEVQFLGKVTVADTGHIEIAECEVLSVNWPTEKRKSPITISDWSWSRDYVGGVEWNFRLTNNTDKVIKYISMKWNCYNAVGDLVYDEITRDYSHGVKYTGPLNPNETTGYLCNPTRFYSHSFNSSKFTLLQVEFMDGTIIRINDKTYTDYYVSKLEAETVIANSGMKYIVNNNLNTCYVADIGTCTDTYMGILSSLYGNAVTKIGDYAFEDASFIETVSITTSLKSIGNSAFLNCSSLTKIIYYGTVEEWNAIEKGANWDYNTGEYIIHCNDGQILKDGTIIYD